MKSHIEMVKAQCGGPAGFLRILSMGLCTLRRILKCMGQHKFDPLKVPSFVTA